MRWLFTLCGPKYAPTSGARVLEQRMQDEGWAVETRPLPEHRTKKEVNAADPASWPELVSGNLYQLVARYDLAPLCGAAYSVGALILLASVLQLLDKYPNTVDRVVLVNPLLRLRWYLGWPLRAVRVLRWVGIGYLLGLIPIPLRLLGFPRYSYDGPGYDGTEEKAEITMVPLGVLADLLPVMDETWRRLRSKGLPEGVEVLIIYGDSDWVASPAAALALGRLLPDNVHALSARGVGHQIGWDHIPYPGAPGRITIKDHATHFFLHEPAPAAPAVETAE